MAATVLGACAPTGRPDVVERYVQANIAGGWADGAELRGVDDVVAALGSRVRRLDAPPRAVFLNEACESHAVHLADDLGPQWHAFFVQTWPGHSDCFPAPDAPSGRFGNAVLVPDPAARAVVIPSCNDPGSDVDRCLPNWAPPAEQRRAACALSRGELLCSVHLDPGSWQWHDAQLAAIGEIAGDLRAHHERVIVGGDFNARRDPVLQAFGPSFVDLVGTDLPTYPASSPKRDLDHILAFGFGAGGGTAVDLGRCEASFHTDGRCTDHLVLLASAVAR